jgi:hypothetical protein
MFYNAIMDQILGDDKKWITLNPFK